MVTANISPSGENVTPMTVKSCNQVYNRAAGAVCQTMLIAASAHGYAAQWITEWCAYDRAVLADFGLAQGERIAGYVYIGKAREMPLERQRPDASTLIRRFGRES